MSPPRRAGGRLRRRLLILAGIVLAVAGLLALLLLVAPRHVARYVTNQYLSGLQIDVEGVKSIDVDLLRGEISMGPVRFHAGNADPGSIGELGIDLSLRNLFERQALLRQVVLRDVDVTVRQTADGEVLVNGISLRQILAEEVRDEPEPERQPSGWGTGVDDLGLRDVHVTFINRDGGTAELTLDHLDLRGFRSWEPEQPGTFVLSADLNGIEINAYGTARPFAEKITTAFEVTVDGVGLPAIERYTGPLGFTPTEGTLTVYAENAFELFPDGQVDGTSNATLVAANIHVAAPDVGQVRLDQGGVTAQLRAQRDGAGTAIVTGDVSVKLNQASAALTSGESATLPFTELTLADLWLSRDSSGALRLRASPQLHSDRLAVGGPMAMTAGSLSIRVPRLGFERHADGRTAIRLAGEGGARPRAEVQAPQVTEPIALTLASLALVLDELTAETAADRMRATATLETQLRGAAVTLPGGGDTPGPKVSVEAMRLALASLTAEAGDGALSISGTGTGELERLAASLAGTADRPPLELSSDALRLNLAKTNAVLGEDGVRAEAGLQMSLAGIAGRWGPAQAATPPPPRGSDRRQRPAAAAAAPAPSTGGGQSFSAEALTLDLPRLATRPGGGGQEVSLDGSIGLNALRASIPAAAGQPPFDVGVARFRLGLSELAAAMAGEETTVRGRIETALDGLSASQPASPSSPQSGRPRPGEATRLAAESLRLTLEPFALRARGAGLDVSSRGTARVSRVSVGLPRAPRRPAAQLRLGSLTSELSELAFDGASAPPSWRATSSSRLDSLKLESDGGKLFAVDLRTLSVGELRIDSRQVLAIERLVLDRPQVFVTREYLTSFATAEGSRPEEVEKAVEEAAKEGWRFRLGSLGLTGDGRIEFRDTSVEPNTNLTLAINALQVSNLDTGDPAQRTLVRMDATINQFSELALSGWAAPFGAQPDFDLNARLQRLELPQLSPYAAQAIGVNVESGRLSLDATAAADSGQLTGKLDVTLRNLGFSPLSPEQAEKLSAAVGVPVETVVSLLQDDEGRISLALPVSGNLQNPSFDLSDAIGQAVTGALQAAVMAPFQLAFAPVALIARAAGGGSGGLSFEPIPFLPGEAEVSRAGADRIAGLARVLDERRKLTLRVCGKATAADLAAVAGSRVPPPGPERDRLLERLRPELEARAGPRTAAVRGALVEQGAQPRQVAECRGGFNADDEGEPRAEVGL